MMYKNYQYDKFALILIIQLFILVLVTNLMRLSLLKPLY